MQHVHYIIMADSHLLQDTMHAQDQRDIAKYTETVFIQCNHHDHFFAISIIMSVTIHDLHMTEENDISVMQNLLHKCIPVTKESVCPKTAVRSFIQVIPSFRGCEATKYDKSLRIAENITRQ